MSTVEKPAMSDTPNRYTLSNKEAIKVSQETLDKIQSLKLNANPIHFALIYEWLSQIDPPFAKEVEQAIKFGAYNDEAAFKLFTELWTRMVQTLLPTNEFENQLDHLLEKVSQWLTESAQHQSIIDQSIHNLDNLQKTDKDSLTVDQVLDTLHKEIQPEVHALQEETQVLHSEVKHSKERIETLKQELIHANTVANTDELTNIPNRRGYRTMLDKAIKEANDKGVSFAFLLIDIDFFKKVNDTYGHLVGDGVLRYIAKLLYRETKGRDYIARIGGEEFVVLLPSTPYSNAIQVANSLRQLVAQKPLKVKGYDSPLHLTISIGVAMYQLGETADEVFERTDKALYLAKQSGRNQVKGETDL